MGGPLVLTGPTSADGLSFAESALAPESGRKQHGRSCRRCAWYETKFTWPAGNDSNLKRVCNDSGHSLNAQTNGIPLSCGGRFKNADCNLCLACPRPLFGP